MGHKRVKMELIKNERSRMQTYKKRKANLLKKINEFTVLCDVKACLIIFGPNSSSNNSSSQQLELETWAPDSCSILDLIQQYRTSDQPRRCYSVSDYFAEKKKRVDVELAKLRKQIYKQRFPTTDDDRLSRLSADQLRLILGSLDSKLKAADDRIAALNAKRNVGLVDRIHHQQQPIPLSIWQNPDVGFGIEREFDKGYSSKKQLLLEDDDVQDLSTRHCQFEHQQNSVNALLELNNNNNNHQNNYFDSYYSQNYNSSCFPVEGQSFYTEGVPFCFPTGEMSPLMAEFSSPEKGFNFGLLQAQMYPVVMQQEMMIKNQVVGGRNGIHQGLLSSLPGTSNNASTSSSSRPWMFDSAANLDAGMSFISSSSYKQIQFSPMAAGFASTRMFDDSIGGGFEFDGRDHKL